MKDKVPSSNVGARPLSSTVRPLEIMTVVAQGNTTIYVTLLGEGTDVWRPVTAQIRSDGLYVIASTNSSPDDEQWEFPTGTVVRCEVRRLSGADVLVAVAAMP